MNATMGEERASIFGLIETGAKIVTATIALGGAGYAAIDYFATKNEVNQLRCEMDLNNEFIKAKQSANDLSEIVKNNLKERVSLENKRNLTSDDRLTIANLQNYGNGVSEEVRKYNLDAQEAARKLGRHECSK